MGPIPAEIMNLSKTPAVSRPEGFFMREFRSPRAWVLAGIIGALEMQARARGPYFGISPPVFALLLLLLVTLPGTLWTLPAWLYRRWPGRALLIAGGHLFMMYPRTLHRRGGPVRTRGLVHYQPRSWIEEGVPLARLKVEAAWVGDARALRREEPPVSTGSDDRLEGTLHQLDLTDGRRRVSLCKCIDPEMRLVPILRVAGLKTAVPGGMNPATARVRIPGR